MANTFFQFKHFRIGQADCAMKVCTDACLFGALLPLEGAEQILDIGTGTGLLALMAAQPSTAQIEAVELDPAAAAQAAANAMASPWSSRISVFPVALQQFQPAQPYDLIVCNPPFFQNSLRSDNAAERTAKHTDTLTFQEITDFAAAHLTERGKLCVLLPEYEQSIFAQAAEGCGLPGNHRWLVRHTEKSKVIRVAALYSRQRTAKSEEEVIIKDAGGAYTAQFRTLLRDFYLAF